MLQQPPLAIQVELCEGCNLGCDFCGLRGIRKNGKGPHYPMEIGTAKAIAKEIARVGWNSRVIFSMHGEPTLNPKHKAIIAGFRSVLPKAILSMMTNGYGLMVEQQESDIQEVLFMYSNAGLNDLIIDSYSEDGDASKLRRLIDPELFPVEELGPKIPLYGTSHKKFRILFTPPIQNDTAVNRHLCNHCGAAAPLDFSYNGKRCARPFRELAFRYDGSVALCCNDFRGQYPIGNIHDMSIDEIWQHRRFRAARVKLYAGERDFVPCHGCNALSHRVGLLPDRMGKEDMPKPTPGIQRFAEEVHTKQEPLARIYRREWE